MYFALSTARIPLPRTQHVVMSCVSIRSRQLPREEGREELGFGRCGRAMVLSEKGLGFRVLGFWGFRV